MLVKTGPKTYCRSVLDASRFKSGWEVKPKTEASAPTHMTVGIMRKAKSQIVKQSFTVHPY